MTTVVIEAPTYRFTDALMAESAGARKRERTRATLQRAGCLLLDRMPMSALTIAEISRAAGVAHGTFYLYFTDRQDFLADLLNRFVVFVEASMKAASASPADGRTRATTAVYYALFEENPGLMKCLVNHLEDFPASRDAFQALNRNWSATVVDAAQRRLAGDGRAVDRNELMRRAYALGGMIDQYLSALILNRDPSLVAVSADKDAVIDTLTDIWKKGLLP